MVRLEPASTSIFRGVVQILNINVKMEKVERGMKKSLRLKRGLVLAVIMGLSLHSHAQNGQAGLTNATTAVRGYFTQATTLMYAIGALVGLIGAVKVFQKWNSGDPDTSKVAAAWFGSCIFLVVVATVIQGFFGS
jgi:hypothetical protein